MIRYYAYYNHGGYKDMYLGTSHDVAESRYFLPLLPVYEQEEEMKAKVEEWKALPSIVNLSNSTTAVNYPPEARVMMSHAGYKLQYRIIGDRDVFALRDIAGSKDSYGRSCPFVFMLTADTEDDKTKLKVLACYIWNHLAESEAFLSSLFVNDFNVNGLRFDVGELNRRMDEVLLNNSETLEGNRYHRPVVFYIVPDGIRFETAFAEQQISENNVALARNVSRTKVHRYEPPQSSYTTTGVPPFRTQQPREEPAECRQPEQGNSDNSLKNMLGLAKEEDFRELLVSHRQLLKRVEQLESEIRAMKERITKLEDKL